jgi:multiple sugar transport system substrate-binding protein
VARGLRNPLPLLLALLACGGGAAGDAPLELWALGREGEVVEQLLPGLEARHPGLRVRVQQVPWNAAHEKLLTAYVGGAMPDLFQVGNTWIPEFVALGALEPLDARIGASPLLDRGDYFEGILDTNVVDGRTWGVPWYVDTRVLFYRSDVLAAAGVAEAPASWEAFREALERVRRHVGPDRHAILLPLSEWEAPALLALQRGAALLREDGRHGDFQSDAFRDAFSFYVGLFRAGLAPRGGAADVVNLYQDFARGYFAAWLGGPWHLGELARRLPPELSDAWATAPLPGPEPGRPGVSLAGGSSLVVLRGSPRQEEAFRVVEWLSEPQRQLEFHALTGDLPPRRSAWEAGELARDPRVAAFRTQLEHVRALPKVPEWERIAKRIARHAEAAIRGDAEIDEALAALDADAERILEKRRWLQASGVLGQARNAREARR